MNVSNNQRWVDMNIAAHRERSERYARHVQKVNEIVRCPSRQPLLTVDENLTRHHRSMQIQKIVASTFNESERQSEINKQNHYLLERLLCIQQGKQNQFGSQAGGFKPTSLSNIQVQQQQQADSTRNTRTMAIRRHNHAMEIYHENISIAKRIQNSRSTFSPSQFSRDLSEYKRIKSNLVKVSPLQSKGQSSKQFLVSVLPPAQPLPPLFEHNLNNARRKRRRKRQDLAVIQMNQDENQSSAQQIEEKFLQEEDDEELQYEAEEISHAVFSPNVHEASSTNREYIQEQRENQTVTFSQQLQQQQQQKQQQQFFQYSSFNGKHPKQNSIPDLSTSQMTRPNSLPPRGKISNSETEKTLRLSMINSNGTKEAKTDRQIIKRCVRSLTSAMHHVKIPDPQQILAQGAKQKRQQEMLVQLPLSQQLQKIYGGQSLSVLNNSNSKNFVDGRSNSSNEQRKTFYRSLSVLNPETKLNMQMQ